MAEKEKKTKTKKRIKHKTKYFSDEFRLFFVFCFSSGKRKTRNKNVCHVATADGNKRLRTPRAFWQNQPKEREKYFLGRAPLPSPPFDFYSLSFTLLLLASCFTPQHHLLHQRPSLKYSKKKGTPLLIWLLLLSRRPLSFGRFALGPQCPQFVHDASRA
jgi:hypothetical protein